jgi:chromosome segregation ATPase
MAIELNINRLNTETTSNLGDVASGTGETTGKALSALFGGSSLTVTSGSMTDLEALVARIKTESERTKFSLLLTSLNAISQGLSDSQKRLIEQGLALSDKLEELNEELEKYSSELSQKNSDLTLIKAKIESLEKQIEQAQKDGIEHNKLVAEMKAARQELEAKRQAVAETSGKIDKTKNEIASVKGQISALLSSLGENTVKTIAKELATLSDPEKAERPAEAKKADEKELETNPFAAIRESLEKIERDITETIEEQRIENV